MRAEAWWRGSVAASLSGAGILGVAALAPLLIRATPARGEIAPPLDLACLFLPTQTDWSAHLFSYAILGVLLLSLGRGVSGFVMQTVRTQRTLSGLLRLRQLADPPLQQLLHTLQVTRQVDLVHTTVPLAFCYGIRRPRICLSTGMVAALTPEALTALLWHERYHLLQRDPLKVALGRAGAAMCFFLPLPRALYTRYLVAKEVDADAYACAQQGSSAPLAAALYTLLDLTPHRTTRRPPAAAGAADSLETRVAGLLGQPVSLGLPLWPVLSSGALLLVVLSIELVLTQLGVTNAFWLGSHMALVGC